MKKRLLCALLTVMMLVGLVPATALTASAAGISTSESAITVLKQWEGYSKNCVNGYTGYGTKCTKEGDHKDHVTTEAQADAALRAELKELDGAINTFASNNGLALTQNKHDALVLFSFENGTAWTTGTGDFKSAVTSKAKGSQFLNAICWWDSSTADDNRRMVEANMYLNGVYSTAVPSNFIRVEYDANGGQLVEARFRYYDTTTNPTPDVVPTRTNHRFLGWYSEVSGANAHQVTSLTRSRTLYAHWQAKNATPDDSTAIAYVKNFSGETALYDAPEGDKLDYTVMGDVTIDRDFVDSENVRWGRVSVAQKLYQKGKKVAENVDILKKFSGNAWIQLGKVASNGSTSSSGTKYSMNVTVTVTNAYVRVRAEDTIYSKELRRANKGDQLQIVNTSSNDGFLWGQIADSNGDGVCEGWVALLYTNYESVKNQGGSSTSYKVIGTATIVKPVNGYVNLRSGAGTNNQIVGALPYGTRVDLYEIQYVNGMRWGRTDGGWFSLSYAEVEGVNVDDYVNDANVLAYAFVGDILTTWDIHTAPSDSAEVIRLKDGGFKNENRTITHLTADDAGNTWGKISEGWVKISDAKGNAQNVKLQPARYFTVESGVTVRDNPSNDANRLNNLTKGVEFIVNNPTQVVVKGDTIWGYAEKFGEAEPTYGGWVNLASKHVSRTDPASVEKGESGSHSTGKMATIVNTDNVNVREYNDASYKKIGSLGRGVTVAVWEEEDGWYKVDSNRNGVYDYEGDGWVSGKYVSITTGSGNTGSTGSSGSTGGNTGSTSSSSETGLGIIANTYTGVNVRTGAGTGYPAKGKILAGTSVEILEVKPAGASKWGRVAQGWICMDYVTMVSYYPVTDTSGSTGSTGGNTGTSGSNTTASTTVIFTGTVKAFTGTINEAFPETGRNDAGNLIVYKTPDVNADTVRTLQLNAPVTIHELLTVEEKLDKDSDVRKENDITISGSVRIVRHWARINDGYVLRPGDNLNLDTLDEITYTVTGVKGEDTLNVRADRTGTDSEIIDKLHEYDTVTVTSLTILKSEIWGRVEYVNKDGKEITGWVNMTYMTRGVVTKPVENTNHNNNNTTINTGNGTVINGSNGSVVIGSSGNTANQGTNGFVTNTSGYRYTGKVIRTGSVNVRATPSQSASLTTTLKGGAALVIYETTIAEGMAWGRCDAGWVYLYYVDLTPCNTAVDAKVVYTENTIAYTDANCTAVAGTYARMSVVDIYEQVGDMCRCDLGWVHIDNLG